MIYLIAKTCQFLKKNLIFFLLLILTFSLSGTLLALSYQTYENVKLSEVTPVIKERPKVKQQPIALSGESEREYSPVISVIDGDTIEVMIDGKVTQVRFLGINTPEILPENTECYGLEAKKRVEELLEGKSVFLLADMANTDRDPYDRLLRYIYLPDNTQINRLLLVEGYAKYYSNFKIAYSNLYEGIEKKAKEQGIGVWGCK